MKTRVVATSGAPAPIGPYSQGVAAGDHLFCSGQIALDPRTGDLVGVDAAAQTERVLQNIGAILTEAGFSYGDVVKTTIYVVDMADFTAVNAVYARYFDTTKPARSTVGVAALPKGALVEIDAIARR